MVLLFIERVLFSLWIYEASRCQCSKEFIFLKFLIHVYSVWSFGGAQAAFTSTNLPALLLISLLFPISRNLFKQLDPGWPLAQAT